jgi:hypothetical protein
MRKRYFVVARMKRSAIRELIKIFFLSQRRRERRGKYIIHILITFITSNIASNVFRYLLFYIKYLCVLCASARDRKLNIQFATKAVPAP